MAVANILAYCDSTTITSVKSFIVLARVMLSDVTTSVVVLNVMGHVDNPFLGICHKN